MQASKWSSACVWNTRATHIKQMNIVCVWVMCKIDTDTTESHKTHNLMLTWPKPSKRRNSSNKKTQNAVTQTKLVPLSKWATHTWKNESEKKVIIAGSLPNQGNTYSPIHFETDETMFNYFHEIAKNFYLLLKRSFFLEMLVT